MSAIYLKINNLLRKKLKKYLYRFLIIIGISSCIFIGLAFTSIPFYAYHSLAATDKALENEADVIVIMGGDGMPSPSGLMRIYHAALLLEENPNAKIIIAQPTNKYDTTQQLDLMRKNLISIGVDSLKVAYATKGYNTRTQAIDLANLVPLDHHILIVSSAEHIYRSIKAFEKVGFKNVGSGAAFDSPIEEESLKRKQKDDNRIQNVTLRYNFWNYMQYEIRVIREYFAIVYYWLKGWI